MCVSENGLMRDTGDGTFSPNAALTRAMIADVLYGLDGRPEVSGEIPFSDVDSGDWYTAALVWCYQRGMIVGYADGTVKPNAGVTIAEAAVILWSYGYLHGRDVSGRVDLSDFTDAAEVPAWALDSMQWAVYAGIYAGRTPTTLAPNEWVSRADVALMVYRYCQG